ncbi:MAG: hypothetical protein A3G34_12185 [Candidatus Lindowbacteria bacterium RIFCSPLOWO2_12_FULL_62_27]|nr:MAG: hypothetical protein A3G34_12185 [Candidatus Lindowbacteria bacterium RIFCSPLOWO2_12_FULL_62_27]OGH63542.1 MAG: hypothetical protein A3I06_05205 [Candidatus Lindowbacteria bacterium RIFCSPLOWO2_02_FULL_62_12]
MTESGAARPRYFTIWVWLVVLTLAYLAERLIGVPHRIALGLVFGIALVKALLVAWNYMHLRHESRMIFVILLIPILLFAILVTLLLPDIAFVGVGK